MHERDTQGDADTVGKQVAQTEVTIRQHRLNELERNAECEHRKANPCRRQSPLEADQSSDAE